MPAQSDDDYAVHGSVGLSMPDAQEPMAMRDPTRGGNRTGSTAPREGRLRTDPRGIIARSNQHLGDTVHPGSEVRTQGGHGRLSKLIQQGIVAGDLPGEKSAARVFACAK